MSGQVLLTRRHADPVAGQFRILGNSLRVDYQGRHRIVRIDGHDVDMLAQSLLRDLSQEERKPGP